MLTHTILVLGRLRQEDRKFKASFSHLTRLCLKTNKTITTTNPKPEGKKKRREEEMITSSNKEKNGAKT